MLSPILTVALLSTLSFASTNAKRQAPDGAAFTSAAGALISAYIPTGVLPDIESRIASAASEAGVSGSPESLLYDGLLGSNVPGWFKSAIPAEWSTQFAALESGVDALRPTPGSGATPFVVVVTTTDSAGSTYTTSFTSTPKETGKPSATGGTTVDVGDVYTSLTTQVIDGVTSVFETAFSGASSVATEASGVVSDASSAFSEGISGASSVATEASGVVSHASSAASEAVSGASSVATEASGVIDSASSVATEASGFLNGNGPTSTSAGGAGAMVTGVSGAAAGAIAMVWVVIAL